MGESELKKGVNEIDQSVALLVFCFCQPGYHQSLMPSNIFSHTSQLHLIITPHQTGELHILGITYSLSGQSSAGTNQVPPKDVGNKEIPDSPKVLLKRPASFASSVVAVQGRQDLDIQGPRLNSTKQERCSVVYGPDRRLDLVVAPPMPLLEVR